MSYLDMIEAEMRSSGEDLAYTGGVSESVIDEFEKEIGVFFPKSYRLFLAKFGALSYRGDNYYGATKAGVEAVSIPSVIFATKNARLLGDADDAMVVIKSSGFGPIYSIDTSQVRSSGESLIVETELSFKRNGEKKIISNSFEDFLVDSIRDAIKHG